MATLPPYSLPQSVFMISLGSNALFDEIGPKLVLQDKLSLFLGGLDLDPTPGKLRRGPFFDKLNQPDTDYPCLTLGQGQSKGDWGVVWGPVVVQVGDNAGATNAMYVAHSPSLDIYVVAIAGTNPTGWEALSVQDLDVAPANMLPWPPVIDGTTLTWGPAGTPDPSSPAIAGGTATGLGHLVGMTWPSNDKAVSVQDFLASVAGTDSTLVFTGHSLGGALAPTLAMLLYPNAGQKAPDPLWKNVYLLPTAGPTPGTPGFANLFFTPGAPAAVAGPQPVPVNNPPPAPTGYSGVYAPVATGAPAHGSGAWSFAYWNVVYANVYDIVPRAWYGLAGLVVETATQGTYQSFFAGGAELTGEAGKRISGLMAEMTAKVEYSGDTTPYYVPCLVHSPFNGTWGKWAKEALYPPSWISDAPPASLSVFLKTFGWVLNAHLGQYSQAFLGYPSPTIKELMKVIPAADKETVDA